MTIQRRRHRGEWTLTMPWVTRAVGTMVGASWLARAGSSADRRRTPHGTWRCLGRWRGSAEPRTRREPARAGQSPRRGPSDSDESRVRPGATTMWEEHQPDDGDRSQVRQGPIALPFAPPLHPIDARRRDVGRGGRQVRLVTASVSSEGIVSGQPEPHGGRELFALLSGSRRELRRGPRPERRDRLQDWRARRGASGGRPCVPL